MIKSIIILIALIVALALTGVAFAQEKEKPEEAVKMSEPEEPSEPAQPAEVTMKEAPKVVSFRAGGVVTSLDLPGKKITIKQDQVKRERTLILRVSKKAAKDLAEIKVGDVVNVWGTGNTVTVLKKIY